MAILKNKSFFEKYPILYASEKIIKMENSLLVIFDEIWPEAMYYSTGTLA